MPGPLQVNVGEPKPPVTATVILSAVPKQMVPVPERLKEVMAGWLATVIEVLTAVDDTQPTPG